MDDSQVTLHELGGEVDARSGPPKSSSTKVSSLISTALAIQEEDAAASGQIGYMARAMIWASMPHKKVDGAHFRCDNGIATVSFAGDSLGAGNVRRQQNPMNDEVAAFVNQDRSSREET